MKITISHLKIFLFVVALHSFFVGVGLMFIPVEFFVEFGYNKITENYFRAQGGIFHWVMVVAYIIAMKDPVNNKIMVKFSIIAKSIAVIFLLSYYFFVDAILVLVPSALGDLFFAIVILMLSNKLKLFDV